MHYQYVVQFDVSTESESAREAHDALIQHLHAWLDTGHVDAPSLETLTAGEGTFAALPRGARAVGAEPHLLRWERAESADRLAHRVDVKVPLDGGHAFHVTRVTVASDNAQTSAGIRVVMATEVTDGWITPAEPPYVRRPGIVRRIVSDASLTVRRMRQRIDGQYDNLRADAEIAALAESLETSERLPVLVAHPTSKDAWGAARALAQELPGLAQVVTLGNRDAWINFNRRVPEAAVPWGGARLVWADITHPQHYTYKVGTVSSRGALAEVLLRTLAPLSVAARGQNDLWYEVQRAARETQREATEEALRNLEASASADEQIQALKANATAARDDASFWFSEAERLESRAVSAETELEAVQSDIQRLQWYKDEYVRTLGQVAVTSNVDQDAWDALPHISEDAPALYAKLTELTNERLVFTSLAHRSWRRSKFNFPERMHDALVSLAKASVAYAEAGGDIQDRREDWFSNEWGLHLALTDSALSASDVKFDFEGEKIDVTPHIKLGDAKAPRDIGRIYFAFDKRGRFVVHHVGIHDFGS